MQKIVIGLLFLILVLAGLWWMGSQEKEEGLLTIEEAENVAREWIKNNSPTYVFDGEELEVVEKEVIIEGSLYSFLFEFQSRSAGYGDRSEEMTAQVITEHTMEVVVDRGEVVKAVTDGVYSEIDSRMIVAPREEESMMISVFFGRDGYGEELFEITREVGMTQQTARAALTELIGGPTEDEKEEGYFSSVNKETEIQSLSIENGTAYVDFSSHLEEDVAGSAMVSFIRNQINETLKQFESVDDVVISINGRIDDILQP